MEKILKNKNYFFQISIWDMIFYLSVSCVRISLILDMIIESNKKLRKKNYRKNLEKSKIIFFKNYIWDIIFFTIVNIVSKFH